MGIFSFFKKKKIVEELEETISFNEINDWIENKEETTLDSQKQPKKEIENLLKESLEELEKGIEILKALDLKEKKVPERAKMIVKQNLYNFINYLEKLIQELEQLTDESLESLINKINNNFSEFEKKSIPSFQKSTFLIGEELGKIRDIISTFYQSFNKIIQENKSSLNKIRAISNTKEKLKQINNINKTISENKQEITETEEKIESLDKKIQNLTKEIENIKQTPEYLEQITQKQELESLKTKLTIEFQALKDLISFKALAKAYHTTENKMSLIKDYKDNFKETFEKHNQDNSKNQKFLDLIDIKEIDKKQIREEVEHIENIKEGINNIQNNLKLNLTANQEKEIEQINRKIRDQTPEIQKNQKLIQKFEENKELIKQEIIKKLAEIKVIVED